MLLTVSKRLEFSASRRLRIGHWSDAENLSAFGPETSARYGSGSNYVAYFVFTGPVDATTGMLINISEIKDRAGKIVRAGFDHKFLNEDNSAFRDVPPTAENIARQLYLDVTPLFSDGEAKLCACHLTESSERSATYYATGVSEANYWFEFSAARRTMSPHLSAEENARLFGPATSTHGHNYRARLTFRSERFDGKELLVQYDVRSGTLCDFVALKNGIAESLDPWRDRHLDLETEDFRDTPSTGENIVRALWPKIDNRLGQRLVRLRLWETANNRFTLRRT